MGIKVILTSDVAGMFDIIGEHLKYENRFSLPDNLKKVVDQFCKYHTDNVSVLPKGQRYYRARINPVGKSDAYELSQVGAPPKGVAGSGRINPKGISYLYGASNEETALSEVRPWKGAVITVATFVLKDELLVANFTEEIDFPLLKNIHESEEGMVTGLIARIIQSRYFSTPAHAHDEHAYLASQFIAEQLKSSGIDGILYPSVLSNTGKNICIFNPEGADFLFAKTTQVLDITYTFE